MLFVTAILPVFIIILIGYLCRYYWLTDDAFWRGSEKITYFLLFPSLLVSKMSSADISGILSVPIVATVLLLYSIVSVVLVVIKPYLSIPNTQFTSVYQGGIRFNTYIGLAVVSALYGPNGLVIAVILAAIMIPVINICCILLLEFYRHHDGQGTTVRVVKSVFTNPLILACIVGIGINLGQINQPVVITQTLEIFSKAALPMGLLTVGAALQFSGIKSTFKPLMIAGLGKFFLLPCVAMLLCQWFDIESDIQQIMLVLTLLPTATASYVLAKQLGGDYRLMATIITTQTLAAILAMPLMLIVLR